MLCSAFFFKCLCNDTRCLMYRYVRSIKITKLQHAVLLSENWSHFVRFLLKGKNWRKNFNKIVTVCAAAVTSLIPMTGWPYTMDHGKGVHFKKGCEPKSKNTHLSRGTCWRDWRLNWRLYVPSLWRVTAATMERANIDEKHSAELWSTNAPSSPPSHKQRGGISILLIFSPQPPPALWPLEKMFIAYFRHWWWWLKNWLWTVQQHTMKWYYRIIEGEKWLLLLRVGQSFSLVIGDWISLLT